MTCWIWRRWRPSSRTLQTFRWRLARGGGAGRGRKEGGELWDFGGVVANGQQQQQGQQQGFGMGGPGIGAGASVAANHSTTTWGDNSVMLGGVSEAKALGVGGRAGDAP